MGYLLKSFLKDMFSWYQGKVVNYFWHPLNALVRFVVFSGFGFFVRYIIVGPLHQNLDKRFVSLRSLDSLLMWPKRI